MATATVVISLPTHASLAKPGVPKKADDYAKSEKLTKPMNASNETLNNSKPEPDDFQQIKGIGPSTAQALHNLGLHRYLDLAKCSAGHLADLLKPDISTISAQRIESGDWLGQAKALAAQNQPPPPAPAESGESEEVDEPVESDQSHVPPAQTGRSLTPSREGWRELGDFFVSFGVAVEPEGEEQLQTKAHYSQGDKLEQWSGIATDDLLAWMLKQVDFPLPAHLEPPTPRSLSDEEAVAEPVAQEAILLELSDLWVSEALVSESTRKGHSMSVLRAESQLNVSGEIAMELTHRRETFVIEAFLMDMPAHNTKLAATFSGQLEPSRLRYDIRQDIQVPALGRYQLVLVARLLPPNMTVTHLQGPVIRVEP